VRFFAKGKTGKLGKECLDILQRGVYLSDATTIEMVKRSLENADTPEKDLVLDGFPRNLKQAKAFNKIVSLLGLKIGALFYMTVDKKTSIKRLLVRGRDKYDTPELINSRLQQYNKDNGSMLDFYKKQKLLYHINGCPAEKEVFKKIKAVINKLKKDFRQI